MWNDYLPDQATQVDQDLNMVLVYYSNERHLEIHYMNHLDVEVVYFDKY